jgi:surface polysaccharide O-acyltransferase-like enzyme
MKNGTKEIYQYVLGSVIVIGIIIIIVLLINNEIPEDNKDALNLVIGAIIGAFLTVVGYFFGSSLGSAKKNDIIDRKKDI